MRAGIFQCDAAGLDARARVAALDRAIAGQGLDLVVCPELFASGYHLGDGLAAMAEPRDGPFARSIGALARAHGTAILYGYPECAGDGICNSAQLIGPDGPVAHHRKLVIPPGPETGRFAAGQGVATFDLGGLRCAILICYDAEFPETVRAAALNGAEAVLVPTALSDRWGCVAEQMMPTRAFENGLWLLYANHAGAENGLRYFGGSRILGPDGRERAVAGSGPELIVADLDAGAVRAARARLPYLADLAGMLERLGSPR